MISSATRLARFAFGASLTLAALSSGVIGCSKDSPGSSGAASAKSADPAPSATPAATASATPPPSASAAAVEPPHDCPKGSTGEGSFAKPCEAKGNARMMEAQWNGKTDDKGPFFRITNKSPSTILYGKIAVYFYDKAGKQLDVQDTAATPPKAVPYRTCSGNIFSGVMKPAEKATIQFSCVKKEHVPDGTAAIEAELQTVGFSDASEKKVDFYWSNKDLTPDARKKGGVK
ncbi:MAG: hypothetical protein QOI41_2295 [Myxococcales bacterium]|jgi:hypothetical protein|nr:hypothetical protein [Myxococcales bacterium]